MRYQYGKDSEVFHNKLKAIKEEINEMYGDLLDISAELPSALTIEMDYFHMLQNKAKAIIIALDEFIYSDNPKNCK